MDYRIEHDSMGEVQVPADRYWGAQTQRSRMNFPIGVGIETMPREITRAFGVLKKAAAISGNKRAEMIHVKELPVLTGYIRGGCSPIGMKKQLPTYIEETAQLFDRIAVSAGIRGQMLMLDPEALREFVGASYGEIVK